MRWSERYMQKKNSTHTGVEAPTKPTKPPLVSFVSTPPHDCVQEKFAQTGEKPAPTYTNYGKGYRHPDGRIETGQPDPMPRPALEWPADLAALLRRVSTAFEWSTNDVRDFRQWAQRSPDGLADARVFLEAEAAKLPTPGLDARRRFVMERLAADPALRVAWLCEDDGADPLILALAIRGKGTCELAVPRAKLDALALPQLIAELTKGDAA